MDKENSYKLYGVITTLIVVFILYLSTTSSNMGGNSSSLNAYKASFNRVDGLNIGDDVRLSGSSVGTVSKIWLNKDLQPNIEIIMGNQFPIPEDSYITIHNLGYTGKMYVDIEAGTEEDMLRNHDWFENTQGVMPLHRMLMLGYEMAQSKKKKK